MDKIVIEHLRVTYSDGLESLRDISLSIPEKAVTVLFGPAGGGKSTLLRVLNRLNDLSDVRTMEGRVLFNGFPTGVEVCPSMNHGGPYPATTDVRTTSVGTAAIFRFARPICFQNAPQEALPPELQDGNPRGIWRFVNGKFTQDAL